MAQRHRLIIALITTLASGHTFAGAIEDPAGSGNWTISGTSGPSDHYLIDGGY
ncbi:hypothetical protein [Gilvimarinus sp. 1_MG-2023]|uniref:hypothetical protein n=1 Tax=Gilvimarinus sp. 1_MG-2023 TaxID=3062638 RepID=UPI0026E1B162|nr:hypothetical protein [Gilvimarinus sp. 1_MG-2023]MDO6746173.1 hypothetical protein [Gilvimarinus sp. 1_MG-2023]